MSLFPQAVVPNPIAVLTESDGTTPKTIATGSGTGTKIHTLKAYNNGAGVIEVVLLLSDGANTAILDKVTIPANSSINLFDDTRIPGIANDGSMVIGPGVSMKIKTTTLPAAGETVDVVAEATTY